MPFNITDVSFDESRCVVVEYVGSTNSATTDEPDEIEFQPHGVMLAWETTTGTAPDPVVTTRFVRFVPYTNIKAIRQSWQV